MKNKSIKDKIDILIKYKPQKEELNDYNDYLYALRNELLHRIDYHEAFGYTCDRIENNIKLNNLAKEWGYKYLLKTRYGWFEAPKLEILKSITLNSKRHIHEPTIITIYFSPNGSFTFGIKYCLGNIYASFEGTVYDKRHTDIGDCIKAAHISLKSIVEEAFIYREELNDNNATYDINTLTFINQAVDNYLDPKQLNLFL